MSGKVVVCGASGFVGRHVVIALKERGADVVCGSRNPDRARTSFPDQKWITLDIEQPETLRSAFRGADAVIYLVHHMRKDGDLESVEVQSAKNVRDEATACGVRRIVYLGAPEARGGDASEHLRARLRTGEVLRTGATSVVELRAGMVVGTGSESWVIVRDLALRLPIMVLPRWLRSRSQPIGIDDVVTAILHAVDMNQDGSRWFDLPGPEALSGRDVLARVAAVAGLRPFMIDVPVLTPSLSSHWIRLVTRADYTVARKLVDGLTGDLVAPDRGFWTELPGLKQTPFDEAVRRALASEQREDLGTLGRGMERATRLLVVRRA
jgi:uncharacterized protein YbjT (DUF2867 family)